MCSILRSKKLNLKYGTASLLEVESGSNDPVAYLMTTILLAMMTSEITPGKMLYMIFAQIVYGAVSYTHLDVYKRQAPPESPR